MKIGLQIPSFTWPGGSAEIGRRLEDIGKTADDAGFASIWVMDHFFQIEMVGKVEEPMLEGYSALSYLADVTKKARLGMMVAGVIYRHPGFPVKTATTLDVLSGGRAYFGIGAAWNEREARGLGVPFPGIKERFERLEETLQIAKQMWSGSVGPYKGRHYQLAETLNSPQPVSRPHPPILIGGMGEEKTLRLVSKYANACNLFAFAGNDVLCRKLDLIKHYCDEIGRLYNDIERTTLSTVNLAPSAMSVPQVIETCRSLAAIGIQHAIFNMPNVSEIKPLETFGKKIIPAVKGF
jgi:F420-dependent oxidoreductase-like protein